MSDARLARIEVILSRMLDVLETHTEMLTGYRPVSTAWIGSGLWLQSPSGSISLIQPRPHLGEVPR